MSASYQPQTGQIFARYQIVRMIGGGGMGTVYEAIHPALKQRFAIKTLLPAIAQVPEFRTRFLREAEVAARINHPNIVRVTDVGTEDEIPYMVMEYLEGNTLGHLLTSRGRLECIEAADILLPILSAVAAGHAAGIIHRDLKPENIFLTQGAWGDLVPKVLDFGVSKLMSEDPSGALTGTLTVLGTAAYMSPEQARGARQVTQLSDQYALGLILYEMLSGNRAHQGDNAFEILFNISNLAIIPLLDARPDCPPELAQVVMRMLSPEPENRYRSLLEVGAALLPFASDRSRLTIGDSFRQAPTGEIVPLPDSSVPVHGTSTPVQAEMPLITGRPRGSGETTDVVHGRFGRPALVVGAALVGAALLGGVLSIVRRRPAPAPLPPIAVAPPTMPMPEEKPKPAPPAVRHIDLTTIPAEAGVSLDNGSPQTGQLHTTIPADGESHVIRVWAEGYEARTISLGPGDMPSAQIRLDPLPNPSASARKPRTKISHNKRGEFQPVVDPPEQDPKGPRRGANDAFILE